MTFHTPSSQALELEVSEGAESSVDAVRVCIEELLGKLAEARMLSDRSRRLSRGTSSAAEAIRLSHLIDDAQRTLIERARGLYRVQSAERAARNQAASQASMDMLSRIAEGEPGKLLNTFGD